MGSDRVRNLIQMFHTFTQKLMSIQISLECHLQVPEDTDRKVLQFIAFSGKQNLRALQRITI